MTRIQLRIYAEPGAAEVFVQMKCSDGTFEPLTATIDTGGELSLFPIRILDKVEHQIVREKVVLEQAGIAKQEFEAIEAIVTVFLEDQFGAYSKEISIRAWFADTLVALIGFHGILDSAILHIDTLNTRTGWIELAD
jgi:hypothetical protein